MKRYSMTIRRMSRLTQKKKVQRIPTATPGPHTVNVNPQSQDAESILQLQQTVGNQNVMRMLATAKAAAPTIQRAGGDFGLKTSGNVSSFATEAVAFWKKPANKDKPLKDYADFLMDKVNAMLTAKCLTKYSTSGADSGQFDRTTWTMSINTSKFSTKAATDTVGELTADEAGEVADTIYHEARHSQQYYTAAQILAGEKKDTAAIMAELTIPEFAAKAGFENPVTASAANADMISTVKDWQKIGAGIHQTYKGLVNSLAKDSILLVQAVTGVSTSTLATVKSRLTTDLKDWKDNRLPKFKTEQERLEKMSSRSSGDDLILSHTKKIVEKLEALIAAWEKDTSPTVESIGKLKSAELSTLQTTVYAAYRDHLHEKDAWEVGAAAGKEFRSLASK